MTKHLRLIMLSLFAMICLGGYSAVGDTYKLVKAVEELKAGDVIAIANNYDKYHVAMTDYNSSKYFNKIDVTFKNNAFVSNSSKISEITLENAKNGNYYLKCSLGYLTTTGSGKLVTTTTCTNENIATITFDEQYAKISFGDKNTLFICYNSGSPRYACYIGGKTSQQRYAQIYKKDIDKRQDTGIHFAKESYTADIAKGTFNEAELVNPNGLEVAYEITPKTEGVSIAKDGTVTYPAVEAKYTVTAKFAGNDTYKPATATYTLNVVDPNVVVFDAAVDKGTREASGKSDKIVKADQFTTTLYGSNAAFKVKNANAYRFYASSHMQISVTKGIITKIKIEGNSQDYPLGNLKLRPEQPGKITSSSDNEVIWEGSANSVRFFNNTSKQFRVSKITVTVKPHYTLDETVDNVVEAAENVNVTLKRTFYKDGEWNTLCLPFAVADAKTAFDGAELREVDTEKSNGNTIVFKEATAIEAGKPYLIKWANSSTEAVDFEKKFEGVTLVATATPVVVKEGGISFNGFYKMTAASELGGASVAAIGAGNKLFKVTEGKMKGFRAAFVLSSGVQQAAINVVIDGTATGIEDLVIDGVKANGRVYNLNGQYVGNSLNGLQPGLYIQNGKKVVVK